MLAYVFFSPIDFDVEFECALFSKNPEDLTKWSAPLEQAFEDIKNWVENEGAGEVICNWGTTICIRVPMENITLLSQFIKKFTYTAKVLMAVGVGRTPEEAYRAMEISWKSHGERLVIWSSDLEECPDGDEIEKSMKLMKTEYGISFPGLNLAEEEPQQHEAGQQPAEAPAQEQPQEQPKEKESTKHKVLETLLLVKQHAADIQKLKEINPAVFAAIKKVIDSLILMASGGGDKTEEDLTQPPKDTGVLAKE